MSCFSSQLFECICAIGKTAEVTNSWNSRGVGDKVGEFVCRFKHGTELRMVECK